MPTSLFADSCFSGLNLMTLLLYGAFGAVMLLVPYVLIEAAGYSPVEAGLALLPLPILLTIGSPIMGQLAARMGAQLPLTIGPVVVAGGMLLGLRVEVEASYWTTVLPAISVMALGMAIAVAPLTTAVLGSVEEKHVAMASGFNSAVARHRRAGGDRLARHRTVEGRRAPDPRLPRRDGGFGDRRRRRQPGRLVQPSIFEKSATWWTASRNRASRLSRRARMACQDR